MWNPEENFLLDPRRYIISAIKSRCMAYFNFYKIFSDEPHGSVLAICDMGCGISVSAI